MSPVIHVRNLSCRFGERLVLSGIDLDIGEGEFHVVIGRNGAGKSTLLKQLIGEIASPGATIELWGKGLSSYKQKALAKKRAILPQHTSLNFGYRVIEVVLLGRLPHLDFGRETEKDFEIAISALRRVGLTGFENRSYLTLSGGEQQRVQFARVLTQLPAIPPSLLFLDEPISSLDLHHQHEILTIAREISNNGGTVFSVLHDLNLAARFADRITVIHEGSIAATGTPEQVLSQELLSDVFGDRLLVTRHPILDLPLIVSC